MNLKTLSKHIGQKGLWDKALKDFSEEEIMALVRLIGSQSVNRLLTLIDIAGRPSMENLKEYWKRFGSDIESSIYSEELMLALAARATEFERVEEVKPEPIQLKGAPA